MSLRWDQRLAIGVPAVDDQHRELFRQVNLLLAALGDDRSAAEVGRLLEFLGRYVVEHFAAEERLMREAGYPELEPHRHEHVDFVQAYQELCRSYLAQGPRPAVVVRLNVWLCSWLRRHVGLTDQALGRWLGAAPQVASGPETAPAPG
jgi:hemerythrin